MQLSTESDKALDRWLGPATWFKEHPLDMERFYGFVSQYQTDHGYVIDESALREEIERRVTRSGGSVGEELRDIIRDRIALACDILEFLKSTNR